MDSKIALIKQRKWLVLGIVLLVLVVGFIFVSREPVAFDATGAVIFLVVAAIVVYLFRYSGQQGIVNFNEIVDRVVELEYSKNHLKLDPHQDNALVKKYGEHRSLVYFKDRGLLYVYNHVSDSVEEKTPEPIGDYIDRLEKSELLKKLTLDRSRIENIMARYGLDERGD
jgi:hypothetical protein